MDTRLLEHRMRALALARECALLGARPRTISVVTGLERYEVVNLLFSESGSRKAGQNPSSPEWLFGKAGLLDQLDASMFTAKFDRLVTLGVKYPEALVTSYTQYRIMREEPDTLEASDGEPDGKAKVRLTFDRAFDLACHAYAIWGTPKPSLMLADCPKCHSRYLTALSLRPDPTECFFCKLLERYRTSERIRKSFQICSRSPVNKALASHLASLISLTL
jgi:hypothetical protein